jgi:hypothetical protein
MEMDVEKRVKKINRLIESRNLLFQHIVKYGCHTKCHTELFRRIDKELEDEGCYLDECRGE